MPSHQRQLIQTGDDIRRMFSRLAGRYDLFNRLFTLGMDAVWRRAVARQVPVGSRVLDIGTGSGQLAKVVALRARVVFGVDFSFDMLQKAVGNTPGQGGPGFLQGRADVLPFRSGRFDVLVSAFVLRSLHRAGVLEESLRECHRVLEAGGHLVFMDAVTPAHRFFRFLFESCLCRFIGAVGWLVFGRRWPGRYLADTMREFFPARDLAGLLERNGFCNIRIKAMSGGAICLIMADKG